MLSQADHVSLRPTQARPLPSTWGLVMAESTSRLHHRWEESSVALADESALQQRTRRMLEHGGAREERDTGPGSRAAAAVGTSNAVAAKSAHRAAADAKRAAVEAVDPWGYYSHSDDNAVVPTSRPKSSRDGPAMPSSSSASLGQPPQIRKTTGLLTPPSVAAHAQNLWSPQQRVPVEVPSLARVLGSSSHTNPSDGGSGALPFVPREILPPPRM